MKRILLLMLVLHCGEIILAQPQTFNYQGIARDEKGMPYANRQITLRLSIRNYAAAGDIVYQETRKVTTNAQGLFSVVVAGTGYESYTGNYYSINWSTGSKFFQTEIDPAGGSNFNNLGVTEFQSTPYSRISDTTRSLLLPLFESTSSTQPLFNLTNNSSSGKVMRLLSHGSDVIETLSLSKTGGAAVKAVGYYDNSIALSAESLTAGLALKVKGNVQLSGGNMEPGEGKVLTSDATGNATWQKPVTVAFRASGMVNDWPFTIQHGTWRKVLFYQAARYNYGNNYDAPNSMFFPPETGVYHLNAQILWLSTNNVTAMRMMLLRNGTSSELARDYSAQANQGDAYMERVSRLSLDIMLQKNDVIWVEAYQTNSGEYQQQLSNAGQSSWFSGHLVFKP